jgi:hypothetical protein
MISVAVSVSRNHNVPHDHDANNRSHHTDTRLDRISRLVAGQASRL